MKGIRITAHAVDRYRERVEPCSKRDAKDRLGHALSISVPAGDNFVHQNTKRRGQSPRITKSAFYRYCEVESLLLVLHPGNPARLVTVLRAKATGATE